MCMKQDKRATIPTRSVDKSEGSPFVSSGFHGNKLQIRTERSTTLTLLKIATIPSITVQRMENEPCNITWGLSLQLLRALLPIPPPLTPQRYKSAQVV